MANKKHVLESIHFLLIGFSIFFEGLSEMNERTVTGIIMCFFGVILLAWFFYAVKTKQDHFILKMMAHSFEVIALVVTAWIFFQEDKKYLQWVTLLSALLLLGATLMMYFKRQKSLR
jgi:hypothetical protein